MVLILLEIKSTNTYTHLEPGGRANGYSEILVQKVDENDQPLAGARFRAFVRDRSGQEWEGVTGANGEFRFTGLLEDDYTPNRSRGSSGYELDPQETKNSI